MCRLLLSRLDNINPVRFLLPSRLDNVMLSRQAFKGFGYEPDIIIYILVSRSAEELKNVKARYAVPQILSSLGSYEVLSSGPLRSSHHRPFYIASVH